MKSSIWIVLALAVILPAAIAEEPLAPQNFNAQPQATAQSNLIETTPLLCLRCHHEMEIGTLLDHGYINMHTAYWMKGILDENAARNGKYWKDKTCKITTAFRCPNCGYVEIHAN